MVKLSLLFEVNQLFSIKPKSILFTRPQVESEANQIEAIEAHEPNRSQLEQSIHIMESNETPIRSSNQEEGSLSLATDESSESDNSKSDEDAENDVDYEDDASVSKSFHSNKA